MRSSGILYPISSLPSAYGIGCFSKEAYEFVDFLYAAGQRYWQVLPFGPTGYGDSPYQSFSTFVGNPYFISLEDLIEKGIETLVSTANSTDNDTSETTELNLNTEKKKIGTNLNKLRKWQFDKFEEEFSAELYIGSYHEYKYAKTKEELCELINTAVKSLGADLELKPEEYKLYNLIYVRTLASLMADAKMETTTVDLENHEYIFSIRRRTAEEYLANIFHHTCYCHP